MKVSDQQILTQLQKVAHGDLGSLSQVGLQGVARDFNVFFEDVERVYRAALAAEGAERAGKNSEQLRGMIDPRGGQVQHGGQAEYGGIPFGPWNVEAAPRGDKAVGVAPGAVIAEGTQVASLPQELRERVGKFAKQIAEDPLTAMALEVFLLREMTEKQGADRLAAPPVKGNWKPAGKITNAMEQDWNFAQRKLAESGLWAPKQHISAREFEAKTGVSPGDYLERYITAEMSSEQLIRSRVTDWGQSVMKKLAAEQDARTPETLASLQEAIQRRGEGKDVDAAVQALGYFPLEQSFPVIAEQLGGRHRDAALILLGEHARQAKHPLPQDHQLLHPFVQTKVMETLSVALFDVAPARDVVLAAIDLVHAGTTYRGAAEALVKRAIREEPRRAWNEAVMTALVDRVVTGSVARDENFLRELEAALPQGSAARARTAEGLEKIEADFQGILSEMRSSRHLSKFEHRAEVVLETVNKYFEGLNSEQVVRFVEETKEAIIDRAQGDATKMKLWPADVCFTFGVMANLTASHELDDAQRARITATLDTIARAFDGKVLMPNGKFAGSETRPVFAGLFDRLKDASWGKNVADGHLADILGGSAIDKIVPLTDIETLAFVDGIARAAARTELADEERAALKTNLTEIFDYWGWPQQLVSVLQTRAEEIGRAFGVG